MKTPEEKYLNDPHYCAMVDAVRAQIRQAQFTPSELREIVIFAAILEERVASPTIPIKREGAPF